MNRQVSNTHPLLHGVISICNMSIVRIRVNVNAVVKLYSILHLLSNLVNVPLINIQDNQLTKHYIT